MVLQQSKWLIKVDKAEFVVDETQYQLLKRAANSGKTMVWFDEFVISLPHVSYMEKIKTRSYPEAPQLPEATVNLTEKIREAKKKLFNK